MRQRQEITLTHTGERRCSLHPSLKAVFRHLAAEVRRYRVPGLRLAAAVAEPAGRVSVDPHTAWQPREHCQGVTVISANLWHDFPRYQRQLERLEAFARLVEALEGELLLLQEVTRRPGLYVDAWLGQRLGMAVVYTRANGHLEMGFEEGLAVLSRFPLSGTPVLRQLSQGCNPFVRRLAVGTAVETACGPLLAFSTHLALPRRQNAEQVASLQRWIDGLPASQPVLVGGDFNSGEGSRQIHQLGQAWTDTFRARHPGAEAVTHTLRLPWGKSLRQRLDYLFLRPGASPWEVIEVAHHPGGDLPHSDHHAVVARLAPVRMG